MWGDVGHEESRLKANSACSVALTATFHAEIAGRMTTLGVGGRETRRRLTSPRIAETVADELRRQIVDGDLADGDLLPPQAVLVERFNVSLVSLREALRILETEGLVSVRRGNQGGAVVHAPTKASAAYMLGLVLQSEHVLLGDLGTALRDLEPTCAALAAQRADRVETIVPELRRLNAAMSESLDEGPLFTDIGRQFHDALVRGCGNSTVTAVVGSLEALWSNHEQRWAERSAAAGDYPSTAERKAVLKTHTALTDAIASGDPERARRIASRHLGDAQAYVLSENATQRIVATSTHAMARTRDWRP
jgi:GntR family transcriptional regulator, transcriptional repressor for pyruvate dehydrogenase complex